MHPRNDDRHRYLLRQPFVVSFTLVGFNAEESKLLRKHGTWLKALAQGEISPLTPAQNRFIQVARGELAPVTAHETAWYKYCKARSKQAERLQDLLHNGTLALSQLQQIQAVASDFDFSPRDLEALERQLERAGSTAWKDGGFIVYSSTKGQD